MLKFGFSGSYDFDDPMILYFGVDNRVINVGLVSGYCLVNQRQEQCSISNINTKCVCVFFFVKKYQYEVCYNISSSSSGSLTLTICGVLEFKKKTDF